MAAPTGIVTPEAVVLEFETAGMASRMLAAAVDAVLQLLLLFAVLLGALGVGALGLDLGGVETALLYVVLFLLLFGYPAAFETLWRGRTPGKAALGLRVVTAEGGAIRFRHAAIRSILGLVDKYALSAIPGVVALLLSRRNQRLGDLVAGTLVLRERTGAKAPTAVSFPPPRGLEGYTAALDVATLAQSEYVTIRSFLLRAPSLTPAARDALARQLATPLLGRLRTTPPSGVPAELFLVCVAAAHQHRHAAPSAARVVRPSPASGPTSPGRRPGRARRRRPRSRPVPRRATPPRPEARRAPVPWAVVAYLDHAATTPMRPEAVAAMLPFLTEHFGNPSGSHAVARRAKAAIEDARDEIAVALGCRPGEIVFTGGGTEADNLAVTGVVARAGGRPVCPAVEHHAVLRDRGGPRRRGRAGRRRRGRRPRGARRRCSRPRRCPLVSVMLANNEVGTIQPLADVVERVRRLAPTAVLHTDAVQAFPWLDVATQAAGADLVSVSAHKFGGPKGVGALVVREGVRLAPVLHGGGQERERRSGTQNVAGIVGDGGGHDGHGRDPASHRRGASAALP